MRKILIIVIILMYGIGELKANDTVNFVMDNDVKIVFGKDTLTSGNEYQFLGREIMGVNAYKYQNDKSKNYTFKFSPKDSVTAKFQVYPNKILDLDSMVTLDSKSEIIVLEEDTIVLYHYKFENAFEDLKTKIKVEPIKNNVVINTDTVNFEYKVNLFWEGLVGSKFIIRVNEVILDTVTYDGRNPLVIPAVMPDSIKKGVVALTLLPASLPNSPIEIRDANINFKHGTWWENYFWIGVCGLILFVFLIVKWRKKKPGPKIDEVVNQEPNQEPTQEPSAEEDSPEEHKVEEDNLQITQLHNKITKLEASNARLLSELKTNKEDSARLQGEIKALNTQLANTQKDLNETKALLQDQKRKNETLGRTNDELTKKIEQAATNTRKEVEKAVISEREKISRQTSRKIAEGYVSIPAYKEAIKNTEKEIRKRDSKISQLENNLENVRVAIAEKDDKIQKNTSIASRQEIEIKKIKDQKEQLLRNAEKKNIYYLYEVATALKMLEEDKLSRLYENVKNEEFLKVFIRPLTKGVGGLSVGLTDWYKEFEDKVISNQEGFFGKKCLMLGEDEVKLQIGEKFLLNLIKSDSFSRFVRLYKLSEVTPIRYQFKEMGLNLDYLSSTYSHLITMMGEFGFQIICPDLFVETFDSEKYQWFNNSDLFKAVDVTPVIKTIEEERGTELIVDVNQIGYTSPWAKRKATAVTVDF